MLSTRKRYHPKAVALEDRDRAQHNVDIARRDLLAAEALLIALQRDGTSHNDPYYIGTRLRAVMASTAWHQAVLALRDIER